MKRELFRKTESRWVLVRDLIGGIVGIMLMVIFTVGFLVINFATNWEMGAAAILFASVFLLFGWLVSVWSLQGYLLWRRMPLILAEYDDELLYLHGEKEESIPLRTLAEAEILTAGKKLSVRKGKDGFGEVILRWKGRSIQLRYVHRASEAPELVRSLLITKELI